jgi:3'-phosphoadenosine 5'-phosphosulfate sulfotransferase (PAPS reductase)/FAD synthetase
MTAHHIVNISGGKDSAATALLAADRGKPFALWMADTDNEHPATVEYAEKLAEFLGKPLNKAKADFTPQIAGKRKYVAEKWALKGVDQATIDRALSVLQPTGNAFLDLCIWKGRFPSRKAQFCTEFLKQKAIEDACAAPLLASAPVVQWLGVRRDESLNRANAPMFQRVRRDDFPHDILLFRPIIHWTAQNVFSYAKTKGLPPNPLYLKGFGRVGCFPCINANKAELKLIGMHYPQVIEFLAEWEAIVSMASKRGKTTFFAADMTPDGADIGRRARKRGGLTPAESAMQKWPDVREVFRWAKTGRGGRQFDMLDLAFADDGLSCSSQYGLCE